MPRQKRYELPPELVARIRAGQANKVRLERSCAQCGEPMGLVLKKRKYCSDRCRALHYYHNVSKLQRKQQESQDG